MHVAPPIVDQRKRSIKHISSVICVVLFIVFLAFPACVVWKSVKKSDTDTFTIIAPTIEQYLQLQSEYPESLTCPCAQFAIDYMQFVHIEITFHEVCSSVFVSSEWISYLSTYYTGAFFPNDFRVTSPYVFRTLSSLCELTRLTTQNSLNEFYQKQHLSTSLQSRYLFQAQVDALISQFRSSIANNFLLLFSMIHSSIKNNALLSALQMNYRQFVRNNSVFSTATEYNGCSCAISPLCTEQSAIYEYPQGVKLFDIPGLYTGCYIIESLLQSNLQCFYDQTCLDQLQTYLSLPTQVPPLDPSIPSRFSPNTTIDDILHELMIEQIRTSSNYGNYYRACQPIQCSYTIQSTDKIRKVEIKDDVLHLIGLLVGIIGGYVAILNLIVPRVVNVIVVGVQTQQIQAIS